MKLRRFISDPHRLPSLVTGVVLLLIYFLAGMKYSGLISPRVATDLLMDNAYLGVLAVGMTLVILTGGIDLSVGGIVGLTGVLIAHWTQFGHWNPILAILAGSLVGIVIGLCQGYLIAVVGITPFLVTLAGLFMCRGLSLWVSKESIQISNPMLASMSEFSIKFGGGAKITLLALIMLAVFVIAGVWLGRSGLGRGIYAVGGNRNSAQTLGLPVRKILIITYGISGLCGALAGVVFTLYTGSGNALSGFGMELDAIAAVVIGGTLLSGGYGSIAGTFFGVLVLGLIQTIITFDGTLSSWWTKIFIGTVLLVFLLLQRFVIDAARALNSAHTESNLKPDSPNG